MCKNEFSDLMTNFVKQAVDLFISQINPILHELNVYTNAVILLAISLYMHFDILCEENGHREMIKGYVINRLVTVLFQIKCQRRNEILRSAEVRAASASKIAQLNGVLK